MAQKTGKAIPNTSDGHPTASSSPAHKYATRAAKNGIDPETRSKYDMKYHVMDEVLRPKRTAKRLRQGRSESVSTIQGEASEADEETASETSIESESDREAKDASETDDEKSGNEDEESGTDDELPVNEPDPRASRRSKRTAGKTRPEYRTKHHPQDAKIPGFQHLARRRPKRAKASGASEKTVQKKRRVEKPVESPALRSRSPSVLSDTVDELVKETLHVVSQIPPSQRSPNTKEAGQAAESQVSGAASSTTLVGHVSDNLGTLDDYLPPDPSTPPEQNEDDVEAYGDLLKNNICSDEHTASNEATASEG